MAETKAALIDPVRVAKDLAVVVPAFVFWTLVARAHVPLQDPFWIWVAAAFTAWPLTGTTWLAFHMLRVVANHERDKKRLGGS